MNFRSIVFYPVDLIIGNFGSRIIYPMAERRLGRDVRSKAAEIAANYELSFQERKRAQQLSLIASLDYAQRNVPYYTELFARHCFEPTDVQKDVRYFYDLPLLTKAEILNQGDRLHSKELLGQLNYKCKTGGSTGRSITVCYDQAAFDHSSAVTRFARTLAGKFPQHRELHFASKFLEEPSREDKWVGAVKNIAMNRSNVFFKDLNDEELLKIWAQIRKARPYMIHSHPSTAYALALAVERKCKTAGGVFSVFESSGELMDSKKREKISQVFECKVFDRYGLAEFGVVAYQPNAKSRELRIFDDFVFPETVNGEIVLTALKNRFMPLIRYATGDVGTLSTRNDGQYFSALGGRVHDLLRIGTRLIPTHHIQDVLDRIGGILEFQIEQDGDKFKLNIVPVDNSSLDSIRDQVQRYYENDITVSFVTIDDLKRVGNRQKFSYLVQKS